MALAIEKYEELTRAMKMEWPALKAKLDDEKVVKLMQDYYSAFLVYDDVMNDRKGELKHLNRCYVKLVNRLHGPILLETD
jgi:hypothetical protein